MSQQRNQKEQKNELAYWVIAIILLGISAPVGIFMIVLKLMGGKKRGRHPHYAQQKTKEPLGSRTTDRASEPVTRQATVSSSATKKTPRKKQAAKPLDPQQVRLTQLSGRAKRRIAIGGFLTVLFLMGVLAVSADYLPLLISAPLLFLSEVQVPLCLSAASGGVLWVGLRKRKLYQRYRNYLVIIQNRPYISISSLSAATGKAPNKVRDDLEDMLNDGLFPGGFLDHGGDMLRLSGEWVSAEAAPSQASPTKTPQAEGDSVLSELQAINDAISNEKLSAQIDRIGVITAKILEYQKNRPEKAHQLHSFLSYYLPTTLKILGAYGQLEAQEVSGENITAAMSRIEGMMDKVVEGFEKQLDQLFQGDAMDITTDVEVLERMLSKDGLSSTQGLTLGL